MIDIHTHILPGLDDGAADIETSLEMLGMAAKDGTECIIATPHMIPGALEKSAESFNKTYQDIKRAAAVKVPGIEILPGAEIFLSPEVPALLEEGRVNTLNNTSYILVEFPMRSIPAYVNNVLYELRLKGYRPIIAHPERNIEIIASPNILYDFVMKGMLTQVNATSLTGLYGRKVRETALRLLKHKMVHFVATDAHTCKGRSPKLAGARRIVEAEMGEEEAQKLFEKNPRLMLENKEFVVPEPTMVKKTNKGIFSFDMLRKRIFKSKIL